MNGWSVQATMSSSVGHGFGVRITTNLGTTQANVYVSATNTLRLVVNGNASATTFDVGSGADPTATYTTGGNIVVRIDCDVDAPVGASTNFAFYADGSHLGTVAGTTTALTTYPACRPERVTLLAFGRSPASPETTISGINCTRWDNDVSSPSYSGRFTQQFNLLPPLGGNPVVMTDGSQFITRPGGRSPASNNAMTKLWSRGGPSQAWSYLSEVDDTIARRVMPLVAPKAGLLFGSVRGINPVTGAFSYTIASNPFGPLVKQFWFGYGEPLTTDGLFDETPSSSHYMRLMPSCVCRDPNDGQALAVKYTQHNDEERVYVVPSREYASQITGGSTAIRKARYTVASTVRTAGNYASRPHPWVYRGRDGRWRVGWFCNDAPAEYISDDLFGTSWSAMSPTSDADAGYLNLVATNFWQGRDGRQAVAGYQFTEEKFVVLTRAGDGDPWTGPYLSVSSSTAAAPYLYERPDGQWEVGWLIGGTWTRYAALRPGGTWSAV